VVNQTSDGGLSNGTYSYYNTSWVDIYNTIYYISFNLTDGTDWVNKTFWFETEADTVTITLISQTPSNIKVNSTGDMIILFNITTNSTAINSSSILAVHTVNQSYDDGSYLNASYRIPNSTKQPQRVRADHRNENRWFEKFNISGTGEIGNIGEWAAHDIAICPGLTINASGTNWTRMKWCPSIHHLFASIWYVDRTNMTAENKTGQYVPIHKEYFAKAEFNMSNTSFIDVCKYKNTTFQFYFYANYTEDKPFTIYFANSSYTTGDPKTSPYCEPVGIIYGGTPYYRTPFNSSYYLLNFSSNETGYVGTVNMSGIFYFIFTCDEKEGKAGKLYYANNTIPDNTNFNETGFAEISDDIGVSWSPINGTFDCHIQYAHLNIPELDVITYKFYAQDNSSNSAWSIEYHDALDIVNIPPNPPDIITPNGTVEYTVGDTVNISYGWLGDPNHDTCWLNITLWNWNSTTLIGYIQNRSITEEETHIYNIWCYDWDTTGWPWGNYTINITATDPDGASAEDISEIFNLTKPPPIFSNPNPANGSTGILVSTTTWNITIETLF
ncbi:unnamed protein product, partial [marine sediment metagenome]